MPNIASLLDISAAARHTPTSGGGGYSVRAQHGGVPDRANPRSTLATVGSAVRLGIDVSADSGLAKAYDSQPKCLVCEVAIVSGAIVVFHDGELVLDCHWDPPSPRRPLSRVRLWPR